MRWISRVCGRVIICVYCVCTLQTSDLAQHPVDIVDGWVACTSAAACDLDEALSQPAITCAGETGESLDRRTHGDDLVAVMIVRFAKTSGCDACGPTSVSIWSQAWSSASRF